MYVIQSLVLRIIRKTAASSTSVELALGPKNSFNNDGSFFENFKKITDAAKKAQQEMEEKLTPALVVEEATKEVEASDVPVDLEENVTPKPEPIS